MTNVPYFVIQQGVTAPITTFGRRTALPWKNTLFSSENKNLGILFTLDVDTELSKILKRAFKLFNKCPEIKKRILKDLELTPLKKRKSVWRKLPG